nr:hypothetical protein [uncultured Aminipila sp.]
MFRRAQNQNDYTVYTQTTGASYSIYSPPTTDILYFHLDVKWSEVGIGLRFNDVSVTPADTLEITFYTSINYHNPDAIFNVCGNNRDVYYDNNSERLWTIKPSSAGYLDIGLKSGRGDVDCGVTIRKIKLNGETLFR